jgi:hypothetical protein
MKGSIFRGAVRHVAPVVLEGAIRWQDYNDIQKRTAKFRLVMSHVMDV